MPSTSPSLRANSPLVDGNARERNGAPNVAGLATVWMLAHRSPSDATSAPSRAAIG